MRITSYLLFLMVYSCIHAQDRPNILWITAEDLSPRLAFYGDSLAHTPNLNRLASEGIVFKKAFSTYGVCAPSRHSIIMGMYPGANGAGAMRTFVRTAALGDVKDPKLLNLPVYEATPPPYAKCFTEYLRARGYFCTNNAKNDYQFKPPLTAWDENGKEAHWRNRPDSKTPFFAVFNFETTHESRIHQPTSPAVTDPGKVIVPPYYPDTRTVRTDIAHHYDNITFLDGQVGEILRQLKEDRLMENTIVFFFGDHGDGLPRAKRWVYDSGIHTPLVVRFPDKREAGSFNNDLISLVDLAPTLLSLCGVDIPEHFHGQAFLGDRKAAPRTHVFAARDRMDPAFETIRAVRDHRYKYIRNYRPELPYIGFIPYRDRMLMMQEINRMAKEDKLSKNQWQFYSQHKPLEELYDLENDPYEIHNLVSDPTYFEKLHELRSALTTFQNQIPDLGFMDENDLVKKLWPPDGIQPKTEVPKIQLRNQKMIIECPTEGASIAYRKSGEQNWKLYTGPVEITGTETPIFEVMAIRLGWLPSDTIRT